GAQQVLTALDLTTQVRRLGEREAVGGQPDRRLEYPGEGEAAEAVVERREASGLARHADRETARARQGLLGPTVLEEELRLRCGRCLLAVVARDVLSVGTMHEREAAAAETARGGVHDADGGRRGDRGVDHRAADAQHLRAGRRGQAVFGGNRPAAGLRAGGSAEQGGNGEDTERARHERRLTLSRRGEATARRPCRGGFVC